MFNPGQTCLIYMHASMSQCYVAPTILLKWVPNLSAGAGGSVDRCVEIECPISGITNCSIVWREKKWCKKCRQQGFSTWSVTTDSFFWMCCLRSSDVGWHIRDKMRPMLKHGSILLYVHGNHKVHDDGQPRTATSTLTQLLNYDHRHHQLSPFNYT